MDRNRRPWHDGTSQSNPRPWRRGLDIFAPYAGPEHDMDPAPLTMLNRRALGERPQPPVPRRRRVNFFVLLNMIILVCWIVFDVLPIVFRQDVVVQRQPPFLSLKPRETPQNSLPDQAVVESLEAIVEQQRQQVVTQALAVFNPAAVYYSVDMRHLRDDAQKDFLWLSQFNEALRMRPQCQTSDFEFPSSLEVYTDDLQHIVREVDMVLEEYNASMTIVPSNTKEALQRLTWNQDRREGGQFDDDIAIYILSTDALLDATNNIESNLRVLHTDWEKVLKDRQTFITGGKNRNKYGAIRSAFDWLFDFSCTSFHNQLIAKINRDSKFDGDPNEERKLLLERLKGMLIETRLNLDQLIQ